MQACDAVSIGLGFEASQLTPGNASSAPMLVECCVPGTELQDCNPQCGDGRVNGDELCDSAIAARDKGACPSSCTSSDPCTPQVLTGSACHIKCTTMPITAVGPKDSCCPKGANGAHDADCASVCGNDVVEPNETCDPPGSCPSCQSNDKCYKYAPTGSAATCDLHCNRTRISECKGGDGCCANGCNNTNDSDCSPTCGNGVIEGNETCENNTDKPCPTTCDDGMACTEDTAIGSADACNADCTHTDITTPKNDDGCCPSGANANNDNDCKAVCGNKTTEPGEECDDGNDTAGDGCDHCKKESAEQVCTSRFTIGSAACTSCNCSKCPDQLQACYAAANSDDAKACSDMVACELANQCNGIDCYCGSANVQVCVLLANGPCRTQMEKASKSTKANDVFDRVSDAKYPSGLASALVTCMSSNCDSDCSP
jgi:cysteine-rich repeat protein